MPHIASSFWRRGRRAGGRRWSHIRWSRRRRLLKAMARETDKRVQVTQEGAAEAGARTISRELLELPLNSADSHDRTASEGHIVPAVATNSDADIGREAERVLGQESGGASAPTARASKPPPGATWRLGYASTTETMETPLLAVPHTPSRAPKKLEPAGTPRVPPCIPGYNASRISTASPGMAQPGNEGSVSGRRAPVPWWEHIIRWRRRDRDTPVAPLLQNTAELEGSAKVAPSESLATSGGRSGSPLLIVGAENHRPMRNSKGGEEEVDEGGGHEEKGEEEEEEGEVVEEEEEVEEAEEKKTETQEKGKSIEPEDVAHDKEEDTAMEKAKVRGTSNEEEKEEVVGMEDTGEKVGVEKECTAMDEVKEGVEGLRVEGLREEVGVKERKGGGGEQTEEEEEEKGDGKEEAQEEQVEEEEEEKQWGWGSIIHEGGVEEEKEEGEEKKQELEEEEEEEHCGWESRIHEWGGEEEKKEVKEKEQELEEEEEEKEQEQWGWGSSGDEGGGEEKQEVKEKEQELEEEEEEEEVLEEKEGWGQGEEWVKEQEMVEDGEGVGTEEDTSGEGNQAHEQQQDYQEESVSVSVGVRASLIVIESSVVASSVPEASSADADADSFDDEEETGSLVPAEFRPVGREDDVLCTWDRSMVPPKTDAAILGAGSYGSVVEVLTESGREVAMKTVVKYESTEDAILKRETELLQECSGHAHVVDLHGFINTIDSLYIIMSKADTTLLSLMQNGGVDGMRAAECIRQLTSATEFIHARSIIHRDIKPANVLLRNGEVLLADFGSAIRTEDYVFDESEICGSEMYLSPEQISKLPHGTAVDMWAIGIVTFELLHGGVHPFWPNAQQMQVAVENAEKKDAHRASGASSADSSVSFIDVGGSTVDVGEDAGSVVGAGDWGGGGDGALSSGTGVRSANVSAVEDSPAHSLGMSPSRMRRLVYATFYERTKAAKFDANEGLDPVAIDFLGQLLQRLASDRMSAAQAADHPWLNDETDMYAIETWRFDTRASTIGAMAVQRALRLDAAVFKAQRAVEWVEDAMIEMEARAEGSSVLGQSSYKVLPSVVNATRNIVSTLRKCAQLTMTMETQACRAQKRAKQLEEEIIESIDEICAPSDMQVGDQELGMVGSIAERKADELVWKAEMCAEAAEAQFKAAVEAVTAWEGTVAEAEEEDAAEAVEAAAAAVEAVFEQRRNSGR